METYEHSLSASRPTADEDWCTVADVMRTTGFSRSQTYRLIARGVLPFEVFAGKKYVRREDLTAFLLARAISRD